MVKPEKLANPEQLLRRDSGWYDMKKLSSTLPINSSRYLNLRYAHP